jgi:hypothetical protein
MGIDKERPGFWAQEMGIYIFCFVAKKNGLNHPKTSKHRDWNIKNFFPAEFQSPVLLSNLGYNIF